MRNRRAGGIVGIVVVAGYVLLRFGTIALREGQEGLSPGAIALSVLGYAFAAFVIVEIVLWAYHLHSRARTRAVAEAHPGAVLVPVMFKRDLVREVSMTAEMLGLHTERIPRSGYGTLVADEHGIGLYAGGGSPRLVLGLARSSVKSVGDGETSGAGRYSFGTIQSLRIVASTPQHFSEIDLPVVKLVVGFPRTLRGGELDEVARRVADAARVSLASMPTR